MQRTGTLLRSYLGIQGPGALFLKGLTNTITGPLSTPGPDLHPLLLTQVPRRMLGTSQVVSGEYGLREGTGGKTRAR